MLSVTSTPIFGQWDHRPAVSSPLSSSPARASSPLSPINNNTLPRRQVQSSPIPPPKFQFSARQPRPNPVMRRREDAQDSRRKLFLQNVRQKSDDKAWQRRDIEGQFLKRSWLDDQGQLCRDAPEFTEADIEDAMTFQQETSQPALHNDAQDDEMVLDDVIEDNELEAMVASYEEQHGNSLQGPPSPNLSDEEYDDIFAELIFQEQARQAQQQTDSCEMDMSG